MSKTSTAARPGMFSGRDGSRRRRLLVLGLPTFGMALAATTVSAYLPVVAAGADASTVEIGLIVGTEGLMALWLPLVAGRWSDRLRTPLGGRLPFILAGTPPMVGCLCAAAFVDSTLALLALVAVFFAGYFLAYEPYRALYPDLVEDEAAGRSQSSQAVWRGLGTILSLVSGGALLALATFLPFVLGAAVLMATVAGFAAIFVSHREQADQEMDEDDGEPVRRVFGRVMGLLRRRPGLRMFVLANLLWELALGAVKTFVVLYVTKGLGYTLGEASLIIGAVAVLVLVGAAASGSLADRHGGASVTEVALWCYGIAILVPGLTTLPVAILVAIPGRAWGADRPLQRQPRCRPDAGAAPGGAGDPRLRLALRLDRRLCRGLAGGRRGDPAQHRAAAADAGRSAGARRFLSGA